MTGLSPYMGWCFPGDGADYDRYLTFRDVPDEEVARWEHALTTFLKKLTLRYGRPLVLKSPPHTARIRLLLGLFPDARFVHIHRDPYVVFRSTRHMIRAVQPLFHLREGPPQDGDDRILSVYTEMYDAYFEERGLIPEGRLCEVGYEDLERDPVGVVGSIYESLGLPGFEDLRPRLESYLGSIAGYRKNRHDDLPEPLAPPHRPRVGPELRRVGLRALTDRLRASRPDRVSSPRRQAAAGTGHPTSRRYSAWIFRSSNDRAASSRLSMDSSPVLRAGPS